MGREGPGDQVEVRNTARAGTGGGGQRDWMFVSPGDPRWEEKGDNMKKNISVTHSKGGEWGGIQDTAGY